jgi:hypothetical protein
MERLKIVRTDSDVISKSNKLRKWAKKNGSQLQSTAPCRHEGHIENTMHTLLQLTRTNADLNDSYWDSTMESVIYAINRTPNSRRHGKTPYELLYGEPPDVSNLVSIGYPTIVKVYDEETDYYEDYDENNEIEYNKIKRKH